MSPGDVTWILMSSALVLFMVPGLALFYGGMSRSKNVLNMLMMNFVCLGVVTVLWVLIGFTLATSTNSHGFFGSFDNFAFSGIDLVSDPSGETVLFAFFAMTFAIITPALVSGAVADRTKFSAWVAFVALWSILVFSPTFYWIYGENGWLGERGSLDFAGGTIVHVSAGAASLAFIMVLGKRRGWGNENWMPHSLPLTLLGAGILWFGWFGFNAGSAGAANATAIQAFLNTFVAAAAGLCAWLVVERIKDSHPTSLGAASGIVAGLVAITPAAGYVGTWSSIIIGGIAGVVCYFAISLKYKLGYDDSLDVVGVHMIGGLVGGILIGFFADASATAQFDDAGEPTIMEGLFYGGSAELLIEQILANVIVGVWSFAITYLIVKGLDLTIGLRVDADEEMQGLDRSEHGEAGYAINSLDLGRIERSGTKESIDA